MNNYKFKRIMQKGRNSSSLVFNKIISFEKFPRISGEIYDLIEKSLTEAEDIKKVIKAMYDAYNIYYILLLNN